MPARDVGLLERDPVGRDRLRTDHPVATATAGRGALEPSVIQSDRPDVGRTVATHSGEPLRALPLAAEEDAGRSAARLPAIPGGVIRFQSSPWRRIESRLRDADAWYQVPPPRMMSNGEPRWFEANCRLSAAITAAIQW